MDMTECLGHENPREDSRKLQDLRAAYEVAKNRAEYAYYLAEIDEAHAVECLRARRRGMAGQLRKRARAYRKEARHWNREADHLRKQILRKRARGLI